MLMVNISLLVMVSRAFSTITFNSHFCYIGCHKGPTFWMNTPDSLLQSYVFLILQRAPPVLDNYGRVVQAEAADQWQAREGVAMLFSNLAPILTKADVETLINFYVPNALHDRDEKVALTMRSAAVQLIEHHGKVYILYTYICVCDCHTYPDYM